MRFFYSCLVVFSIIACSLLSAQEYDVTVTTVNVWLRVLDGKGNPVSGLQKDDFQVFEDNKKMSLSCFEEVRLSMPGTTPESDPLQSPSKDGNSPAIEKRFVLFLDLYNTTQIEFDRLRPQMDNFMRSVGQRSWQVMLVAYLPSGKLGVVSPFTKDIGRIRNLLDQAKGNAQRDQRIKRNENEILDMLAALKIRKDDDSADASENLGSGGQSGAEAAQASHGNILGVEDQMFRLAVNNAYRQAQYYARQDKQNSEHAFSALESFSEYYSSKLSEGEHTIVMFLSGGINTDPGRRYFELINTFVGTRAANANPTEFAVSFTGSTKENNFDIQEQIRKSIGKLNRHNMTLYAMNTRGLDTSGPDISKMESDFAAVDPTLIRDYQDSLSQIAEETGGFSFQNSQNFKAGFDNILNDLSHQYLLCYRAPEHKKSDEYHSIKVTSTKPGLKLRHRRGYVD